MLWSRPELLALLLCVSLGLANSGVTNGNGANGSVTSVEQQLELKLSALRVHKQLLQAEIARLYMASFTPETPLILEELQQRQQDIQLQIERLEGKAQHQDAQHLALSLTADFELLQHKLDDLKLQLDAMQHTSSSNNGSIKAQQEQQRDVINSTPKSPVGSAASNVGSYFFTPLLAMPEFPSGSIAQTGGQSSPSLIKRLMAMLRPNASTTTTTTNQSSSSSPASSSTILRGNHYKESSSKMQLLSAEELLPQLQLQRQFLDDAIRRLELMAVKTKSENKV